MQDQRPSSMVRCWRHLHLFIYTSNKNRSKACTHSSFPNTVIKAHRNDAWPWKKKHFIFRDFSEYSRFNPSRIYSEHNDLTHHFWIAVRHPPTWPELLAPFIKSIFFLFILFISANVMQNYWHPTITVKPPPAHL